MYTYNVPGNCDTGTWAWHGTWPGTSKSRSLLQGPRKIESGICALPKSDDHALTPLHPEQKLLLLLLLLLP